MASSARAFAIVAINKEARILPDKRLRVRICTEKSCESISELFDVRLVQGLLTL